MTCLVLAFALLLAQAGALLHASGHADAPRDRSGVHAQLCVQCLSYSGVFSLAGGSPRPSLALPRIGATVLPLPVILLVADRATARAFRSRAPPRAR